LQIIFHKRATKYRSLLRKMTYKDKGSYESSPPCICKVSPYIRKRALYVRKRALYVRKRALYVRKKALCIRQRALLQRTHTRTHTHIRTRNPKHTQTRQRNALCIINCHRRLENFWAIRYPRSVVTHVNELSRMLMSHCTCEWVTSRHIWNETCQSYEMTHVTYMTCHRVC